MLCQAKFLIMPNLQRPEALNVCVCVCVCERCLLITESPKTPGHYRYLIGVLGYIPYMGLAVFSFSIARVPVYTAISIS